MIKSFLDVNLWLAVRRRQTSNALLNVPPTELETRFCFYRSGFLFCVSRPINSVTFVAIKMGRRSVRRLPDATRAHIWIDR